MTEINLSWKLHVQQGRIQGFHWGGGGGAKDYVRAARISSAKREVPYGRGPGPRLRTQEDLVFWMLYHRVLDANADTKWGGGEKKHSRSKFMGAPPSGSATVHVYKFEHWIITPTVNFHIAINNGDR